MQEAFRVKSGERYGRWLVLGRFKRESNSSQAFCKCDCGTEKYVRFTHLKSGRSVSCGCYRKELYTVHGKSDFRIYQVWADMKGRCQNKKDRNYKNYGGRGVSVCEEWQEFQPFMEWALVNGYADALTIERIDNNGNYEPDNCKWVMQSEQCQNRRSCNYITYKGITKNITQWAKETGLHRAVLYYRISSGWSIEKAFTTPSQRISND